MKNERHAKILELIEQYAIDRQEDLLEHLNQAGFKVTQATVSRDIRQLHLVKAAAGGGKYRYVPAMAAGGQACPPAAMAGRRCTPKAGLKRSSGSRC